MKRLKLKTLTTSFLSAVLLAGATGVAIGQDKQETLDLDALAANALPELSQDTTDATRAGSASMSCFVDTPAFDEFRTGSCFSVGTAFMTTAVFRIDNPPSNYTILWSDSRCSSTSLTCFLPIRQYQTINLSATVLNNANNTFSTTSATARYEGFF